MIKKLLHGSFAGLVSILLFACSPGREAPILNHESLAKQYFQEDAAWYVDNIPFFECSDSTIERVYYYRWKLYKAHIRNIGKEGHVITEFIDHVPWDRDPACTINAASMHHIYEGRWLKNPQYIDGYLNYLFRGGNDRKYSESVADAAYARYLVNADSNFLVQHLDSMKSIYNQWSSHWDATKGLYYIPAMPDATEYNIAAIDASGGKDGFAGGEAFRPTINSYQYGNALAISRIAIMRGDWRTAIEFSAKASVLRFDVEKKLWNDSLQHFTDRYQVSNTHVKYWDFIRGRELAGFAPWYFNLPADSGKYTSAWKHLTDTTQLLGGFGYRTNEPSYQYYFTQFLYHEGKRGSQWNGPSWPYQTSQALTGMANVLNNYHQNDISTADYLHALRLYTKQHFLPDGSINLVENYDPNLGGPIVFFYWSNHYLHSTYNNLVISGLCGVRPSEGDSLTINPLVDESIQYFYLDDVSYHGHKLSVVYDASGSRYKIGKGVSVFVDEKKSIATKTKNGYRVWIGKPMNTAVVPQSENFALNIERKEFPVPSASVNTSPDSLYKAIDGRIWYFPEITNHWTTRGSTNETDWFELDFGKQQEIRQAHVYIVAGHRGLSLPNEIQFEFELAGKWIRVKPLEQAKLVSNAVNTFSFNPAQVTRVRIHAVHGRNTVAFSEIEFY